MAATLLNLAEQVQGLLGQSHGGTGASSLAAAGVELSANKNAANGYAGLSASTLLSTAQLGTGTANSTTFLRGDNTWATPSSGSTTWTTTVSSAATLTLATTTQVYVFSGTTTTWTLPAVSGNTGVNFHLENRGSGNITINAGGADHIWFKSSITSMTIVAGGSLILINDGTYWNALSSDLTNNSVGTLPVANGGTGATTLTGILKGSGTSAFTAVTAPTGNIVGDSDSQTLTNKTLTTPTVTGYTETCYNGGTVTTAFTVNLANGTMQRIVLTNADTCAITMPTAFAGMSFALAVNQPSTTGSGLLSWSGVQWPNNVTPVMSQGANKVDVYSFFCFDGSTIRGSTVQNYAT